MIVLRLRNQLSQELVERAAGGALRRTAVRSD
jgi:hypothetical protein